MISQFLKYFKSLVLFSLTSLISIITFAQASPPGLKIDSVRYQGSGCPNGSVKHTLTEDGSLISFLFDQYSMQGNSPAYDKSCSLRFLLWYPKGYRLKVVGITYRGAFLLSDGAQALMKTKITQQISRMVRVLDESQHEYQAPFSDNFEITRTTTKGDWFQCNGVAAMNYFFDSLLQIKNPLQLDVLGQLDSTDIDLQGGSGFSMQLAWEKCN